MAVKSKGKGKSGGMRVITYTLTKEETIFFLTIYDKSESATVNVEIIKQYVDEIQDSLKLK